jgi:hypothetical protein
MNDPELFAKLITQAYDDVKDQLFYAIEHVPDDRATLLHQLDVLNQIKGRLNARLDDLIR